MLRLRATEQVAGLGQAQAALNAATSPGTRRRRPSYDRIRDMYERKVVARATYDDAVAARDAAAASLAAARAGVESAREGVSYTELRAPYDGVVTAKRAQLGEAVAPGMPLLTVAALDALRVVAEVPQSIRQCRAGVPAGHRVCGRRADHGNEGHAVSVRRTPVRARSARASTCRQAGMKLAPGMPMQKSDS